MDLDILVNAAGISQRLLIDTTSRETVQEIIDTNLVATIAFSKMFSRLIFRRTRLLSNEAESESANRTKSVLVDSDAADTANEKPGPERSSRQSGHNLPCIINISSLLGVKGGFAATAYAASKAGILGFTRALACEDGNIARGMRVNVIVPGYIDTPMTNCKYVREAICFSALSHPSCQSLFSCLSSAPNRLSSFLSFLGSSRGFFPHPECPFGASVLNTAHNVHLRHLHLRAISFSFLTSVINPMLILSPAFQP